MINLQVDECFAFDYLSILNVKTTKSNNQEEAYLACYKNLKDQLGDKFDAVINSHEYENLLIANYKTFDAVDKARSGGNITAKEVDDTNFVRYNAKIELHKKFF